MPETREVLRVVAVLAGSGLILLGIVAAPILAFILLLGVQVPNAYDIPGDPCCSTPDSWGETFDAAAATLVLVYAIALGVAFAIALLRWGAAGKVTRRGTVLLRIPAAASGVAAVLMAGLLFWQRDQARLATDGDRFTYAAAAWQSAERARWQKVERGRVTQASWDRSAE